LGRVLVGLILLLTMATRSFRSLAHWLCWASVRPFGSCEGAGGRRLRSDRKSRAPRVVEAITRSRFWSNSVIFVIEDDPQSGWDHVDGHRSICLVVSPYTKRHQTVSSFYGHTGVLHTMEQILGLPPMNQMDAMAQLM